MVRLLDNKAMFFLCIFALVLLGVAHLTVDSPTRVKHTVEIVGVGQETLPANATDDTVLNQTEYTAEQYSNALELMNDGVQFVTRPSKKNPNLGSFTDSNTYVTSGAADGQISASQLRQFLTHDYIQIDGHYYRISHETQRFTVPTFSTLTTVLTVFTSLLACFYFLLWWRSDTS